MGITSATEKEQDAGEKSENKKATWNPFHQITSEEIRNTAPPPSPSSPLSLAIDPTCTLDLITIGGIVRLFDIDLKNFYTMFIIVDLIMCE
jgi:hypothetical protein